MSTTVCSSDCSRSRMLPRALLLVRGDVNTSRRYWSSGSVNASVMLATLVFRALSGQAPDYVVDDCQFMADSGRRTLRSAERSVCLVPRRNSTFGDRSFVAAGPRVWNDLPTKLRNTGQTIKTFCKHLKTALFSISWGRGVFVTVWLYAPFINVRTYLLTYLQRSSLGGGYSYEST